ncbi:MAG TPA: hypothetical protein VFT53_04960 [Candidatus Saccharimonadales bacterium]|nr:hypothetical protein [Candidatus Saccharimonadales bacterium]
MPGDFEQKGVFELANLQRQQAIQETARLTAIERERAAEEAAHLLRIENLRGEMHRAGAQVVQAAQTKGISPDVVERRSTGPWYRRKHEDVAVGWLIESASGTHFVTQSCGWDSTQEVADGTYYYRTVLGLNGRIYSSYRLTSLPRSPENDGHLMENTIRSYQDADSCRKHLVNFIVAHSLDMP